VAWIWIGFIAFILGMLALDLGVFNRKAHVIRISESLAWTSFWVVLALAFNVLVFFLYEHRWLGIGQEVGHELTGAQAALQFFTGYVIEESLSLDNIFVIALIFTYFGVPAMYQHRALFWGIMGAIVMRGVMIVAGVALIRRFEWIIYVFGVFLIFTAIKLLVGRQGQVEPDKNPLVRLARRLYPVSPGFEKEKFFTRLNGRRAVTPLFLVVLVVESSDLLFAVDSIPAIFAVTRDPFIVFTSNIFAILGLRSLFFTVAGLMSKFRYLNVSLAFVLAYVGVKMLLSHYYPIPTPISLAVIGVILSTGILASVLVARRHAGRPTPPPADETERLTASGSKRSRRAVGIVMGTAALLAALVILVAALVPQLSLFVTPVAVAIILIEFLWLARPFHKSV
jgi:tellurite resistance protein TerC